MQDFPNFREKKWVVIPTLVSASFCALFRPPRVATLLALSIWEVVAAACASSAPFGMNQIVANSLFSRFILFLPSYVFVEGPTIFGERLPPVDQRKKGGFCRCIRMNRSFL
jgi:hypothetical protein